MGASASYEAGQAAQAAQQTARSALNAAQGAASDTAAGIAGIGQRVAASTLNSTAQSLAAASSGTKQAWMIGSCLLAGHACLLEVFWPLCILYAGLMLKRGCVSSGLCCIGMLWNMYDLWL